MQPVSKQVNWIILGVILCVHRDESLWYPQCYKYLSYYKNGRIKLT